MNVDRMAMRFGLSEAIILTLDDGSVRAVHDPGGGLWRSAGRPGMPDVERCEAEPMPSGHERACRLVDALLSTLAGDEWREDVTLIHRAIARDGIRFAAERWDSGRWRDAVNDEAAIERLAEHLARDLERFYRSVRWRLSGMAVDGSGVAYRLDEDGRGLLPWEAVEADLEEGGTLWLDEEAAAYLEGTGATGKKVAANMRSRSLGRADAWRSQTVLPGCERDAGALWSPWYKPDAEPTPVRWARVYAAAYWSDQIGSLWEKGRKHRMALPAAGMQGLLDLPGSRLIGTTEDGRVRLYRPERRGASELAIRIKGGPVATEAAIKKALQSETLSLGAYPYLLFHYIVVLLNERMKVGDIPWDSVPKLELPTGKRLSAAIGAGPNGRTAKQVENALHLLSGVEMRDGRDTISRLWHAPEKVPHGAGRSAAWLVTPGEMLLPTATAGQPKRSAWRRLVYLADEMPDRSIVDRSQGAHIARLGLALPMAWRDAAGRSNGKPWLENPGIKVTDSLWAEIGGGLDREMVLAGMEQTGWIERSSGLVRPGPLLPRLHADLDEWAKRRKKGRS